MNNVIDLGVTDVVVAKETISKDDLAYFKAVAAQKAATDAVWQHWAAYLSTKYNLGPQDQVDSDSGVISRG